MIDVILAAPDIAQEPDLVVAASGCGVRVMRRCVDAVDLLAAAAVDPEVIVVVSAGLPRLSPDVAHRLGPNRRIIGLAADPLDATALAGLGIGRVAPVESTASATWSALRSAVLAGSATAGLGRETPMGGPGVWSTGVWAPGVNPEGTPGRKGPGRLVVVWGPMGAPGRTTVALGVAETLAESGRTVCLVDGDTYAPSVAMALGLTDDPGGGLLGACRQADNGLLDESSVVEATRRVRGTWHVLSGLPQADRWAELSPSGLDRLWQAARAAFDVTVVDIGFCVEDDDAPAAWARRRNAAAVTALASADRIVAVADSSAAGAARLVAAWPSLVSAAPSASVLVVRNRSGRHARPAGWEDAVEEFGIGAPIRRVPADGKALHSCWSRGRSMGEVARRSPLRRALVRLADEVMSG